MKLLLSAYACEPNKGSEPAVGWQWALETVRRGHEVWVLTRANNRLTIENELAKLPAIDNLKFLYFDLPLWARFWKKSRRGIYIYYYLWQWGAYLLAKKVHKVEQFNQVQHVTFVNARQPSFMGNLKIPFVFGPVAGGERAPWRLRRGYGWSGWITDGVRDIANLLIKYDPFVRNAFKKAERIYVTSEQTLSLLPQKYKQKARVQLAIGFNSNEFSKLPAQKQPDQSNDCKFKILYVGRQLYWKGMHLGLPAFARLLKKLPDTRLTLVGSGPDEERWRTMAKKLNVMNQIDWIPWIDRQKLSALYASQNAFLYPSLHDSGGMVILEAMSHGMPVVCLDLGGPGNIVNETCGLKVNTNELSRETAIMALSDCLIKLAEDSALSDRLSAGAKQRVKEFSWNRLVTRLYAESEAR